MPGTSDWTLFNPATNREIEGYASLTSVNIGSSIDLFVSTSDQTYSMQVFRSGWYGGLGARLMTTMTGLTGAIQATPAPDRVTGLIECHWARSYRLAIPTSWTSGVYLVRLTGAQSGKQSYIIFVVRDDGRSSDIVFESSVTTFEAYNFWPGGSSGKSLYSWAPGGRGWKVSFNRPYTLGYSYTAASPGAALGLGAGEFLTNLQPGPDTTGYPIPPAGFEYNMVRWLESNGYDLTYITDLDLHESASSLPKHKAFLSVGHNEYWSMQMVRNLNSALSGGVNAGFFSANSMYWQIRFEADSAGNLDRTMVCYKYDAPTNDPLYSTQPQLTTTTFRNSPVNMPEAALIGVEYVGDPVMSDIVISNASHWLMNGTGLQNGDHLRGLLGYEVDAYVPGVSPANTAVLASSPIGFPEDVDDPPGFNCASVQCNSNVTWYSNGPSSVFATGSMFWTWGLDDFNAPTLRPSYLSQPAQQLTKNVLTALIQSVVITTTSLPSGVVNTAYAPYQLTTGTNPLAVLWSASNLPAGMNLSSGGVLSGSPVSAGTGSVLLTATDSAGRSATASLPLVILQSPNLNPSNNSPIITTATLPFAAVEVPYAQELVASGGNAPLQWSLAGGTLPRGLSLTAAGQVNGTSAQVGSFPISIQVVDAANQIATRQISLVSIGALDNFLPQSMDPSRWCQCILDQAAGSQSSQVTTQQSQGQLILTPVSGMSGMHYNGYSAVMPLDLTDATLSVEAVEVTSGSGYTDTSFAAAVDTANWYRFIVEGGALYFQSMVAGAKSGFSIPYDTLNHRYWRLRHSRATNQVFFETSSSGASWTTQWQAATAVPVTALRASLNSGTWNADSNPGQAVFANIRWEQNTQPALPFVSLASRVAGTVGTSYTDSLSAISGTSPYAWSVVAGALPPGISLGSGGGFAGVPSSSGTFKFTAQLKDANGLVAFEVNQITIAPAAPLTVSAVSLPAGTVNVAYSQGLLASGGTAPYHWTLQGGVLPAGLTLTAAGQISGTPISAASSTFTVQVQDSFGQTATRSLLLTVNAQTYTISGSVLQGTSGLAGVSITLNGVAATTTSNTGAFTLSGLASGTYTVAAVLSGYTFKPATQTFSNITANQTATFSATVAIVGLRAISINFDGNSTLMSATEQAGVVTKAHWNNAVGNASSTALKLVDESGAASPATVTWKSDNTWATPISKTAANSHMMNGYLDTANGDPVTLTVANLPVSSTGYDVYVYFDADNGSATKTMTFSIIETGVTKSSIIGIDSSNENFNGTFNLANNTAGNYVQFTTKSANFTITATPKLASDSILRAAINGIQIIPH